MPKIENCPVCGYDGLLEPPKDFSICPCCGTQFDLDDDEVTHDELRRRWVNAGAVWWSKSTPEPLGWNWFEQMKRAGLSVSTIPTKQQLAELHSKLQSNASIGNSFAQIIGHLYFKSTLIQSYGT